MRVVFKKAEEDFGEIIEVENELKPIQDLVGGYIETVRLPMDIVLIVDEEGKLKGKPVNFFVGSDWIVGDVLFTGVKDDDFDDLSDKQIEYLKLKTFIK